MESANVTQFTGETSTNPPFPENSLPEPLSQIDYPDINSQREILPDHPDCDIQTGDLLVHHPDTESLTWFGELFLSASPTGDIVTLSVPKYVYRSTTQDSIQRWFDKVSSNGKLPAKMKLYSAIASQSPDADPVTD